MHVLSVEMNGRSVEIITLKFHLFYAIWLPGVTVVECYAIKYSQAGVSCNVRAYTADRSNRSLRD